MFLYHLRFSFEGVPARNLQTFSCYEYTPHVGAIHVLGTRKEAFNHDRFAVALLKDDHTVGHIPGEVSKTAWYMYFLEHGGEIQCEITSRPRRSDVAGKCVEVPCRYTFEG